MCLSALIASECATLDAMSEPLVDPLRLRRAMRHELLIMRDRTQRSRLVWTGAKRWMPGGAPSMLQQHAPWPVVIDPATGSGCHVEDVDGTSYVDWHGGYSVGLLGYGSLRDALLPVISGGLQTGFLHPKMPMLAAQMTERYHHEQMVMANDGTGAIMLALRLARAHTGRNKIVKLVGGYHGMHELALQGTGPAPEGAWGKGTSPADEQVISVQANDIQALEVAFSDQVAAMIVEPIMFNVGCIALTQEYLERARQLADEYGSLLILDEVKTGATVSYRGSQDIYHVSADITVVGKAIAGGVPCAIVLSSREILSQISEGTVPYYSTFAGSPLAVEAALCSLRLLDQDQYRRFNELSEDLSTRLRASIAEHELPALVVTYGAKGSVIFIKGDELAADHADLMRRQIPGLGDLYWLMLMNRGILLSPGHDEQWTMTIHHTEAETAMFAAAFARFAELAQWVLGHGDEPPFTLNA